MAFALIQIVTYVIHNRRVAQGKHRPKNGEEPMIYVP